METTTCKQERLIKTTALKVAKKLDEACAAMNAFLRACRDAGHSDTQGAGDSRRLLIESMQEYSMYLDSVHNKP